MSHTQTKATKKYKMEVLISKMKSYPSYFPFKVKDSRSLMTLFTYFPSHAEHIIHSTLTLSAGCSVCGALMGPTSCFLSADPSHFLLSSSLCGSNLWEPYWSREKQSVRQGDIYSLMLVYKALQWSVIMHYCTSTSLDAKTTTKSVPAMFPWIKYICIKAEDSMVT